MKFIFRAKNKNGEVKEGNIEAASSDAAAELLQKNDLFPLSIKLETNGSSIENLFLGFIDNVNSKELMVFFRQLAILIEAKVPIVSSLMAINEQAENKYFKNIITEMINDIQDGLSFSDAMKKHKKVFSTLAINIVKAGEVSGNLRKSVTYIADNIEKNYKLTSRVKSAMMYPGIVMVVFFVIVFLVMTFVVPKLTVMIKEMGSDVVIPWYTSLVISTSDFMAQYWWVVLLIIFFAVGEIIYYLKTTDGSREWDRIKINLPVFGKIYRNLYVTRFADNLAVLLAGGIPIIQALTIVSSVINNVVYEEIFLKAADEVRVGGTISTVLHKSAYIPSIVSQMVRIGEESGQIDLVLKHIANFYEQEVDTAAKNLSTLIEPVLMVIIGIGVALLSFSVIMPIYNLAGQL
jgi:type IV pilus assembly protein PilC